MGRIALGEPKSNQKTLRYTDTVDKIVNSVDGEGFNAKFENICLEYKKSIPERTKRLKQLDKEIIDKEKYLDNLKSDINKYENIKQEFKKFLYFIDKSKDALK